jgi:DNA repair photolyase
MQATLEDLKIRSLTAKASRFKDPARSRDAALKAWRTIRARKRLSRAEGTVSLLEFNNRTVSLPPGVRTSTYKINAPLIKNSKLTYVSKGGVGKQLSDGWALNFAIGCTFGCRFCYVDEIHKKWGERRAGNIVYRDWGYYFSVPENLADAIEETDWMKWKGEEVMLSSTHDPYLPQLHEWTRKMLEAALPNGVRFCIQTRSPLVEGDFDLLQNYRQQIRLQVSIATYSNELSRAIEPRVVPPRRRMEIIEKAREFKIPTGIIIAPVFPSCKLREDVAADLDTIVRDLVVARPRYIFGESVHVRGINQAYSEHAIGEPLNLEGFDSRAAVLFYSSLRKHKLKGTWWPENHHK